MLSWSAFLRAVSLEVDELLAKMKEFLITFT